MNMTETVETKVFDPAELFAQLSRLLELYLARAEDTDALANMSPKDALTCAKTVMALMADLQGGKPASVDEDTQWPRLEIPSVGRGLRAPPYPVRAIRESPLQSGLPTTSYKQPITSLEEAVAAVCSYDEETQALEPWARLVSRIDDLCVHIQRDLDAWRESNEAECALVLPEDDDPNVPAAFQLIESAGADEASDNGNGNNTDFPARRNPRGP